jgi:hypothetical protein
MSQITTITALVLVYLFVLFTSRLLDASVSQSAVSISDDEPQGQAGSEVRQHTGCKGETPVKSLATRQHR